MPSAYGLFFRAMLTLSIINHAKLTAREVIRLLWHVRPGRAA